MESNAPGTSSLFIRDMDDELMRQVRIAAATHGRTVREEVIVRLSIAPPADMLAKPIILSGTAEAHPSNSPSGRGINDGVKLPEERHNSKTCRIYDCGMCKVRKGTK